MRRLARAADPWFIPQRDPKEKRWKMPHMIKASVWVTQVGSTRREQRECLVDPRAPPHEANAYLHILDKPESAAPQIGRLEIFRMLRPKQRPRPDGTLGFPDNVSDRLFEDTTTDPDPAKRYPDVAIKKMYRYCVEHRRSVVRNRGEAMFGHLPLHAMVGTSPLGENPWFEMDLLRLCKVDPPATAGIPGVVQMLEFVCDDTDPYAHETLRPYFRPTGTPGGIQCYYSIQENLAGGDLYDVVADGIIPIDDAAVVSWLRQATEAVRALHALGFIHNDLSCENIMLQARSQHV